MRRVLAIVLIGACSTTRVSVRGGELHRHLHELRTTGRATVEATETRDDAARARDDGTAVQREVRLDQPVVFDRETHTLAELARGCPDDAGDTRIEGCAFSMFQNERFTVHSERHFQPGTAGLIVGGSVLVASYATMSYCAWHCDNPKAANISLVGLGLWAVLTVVFGVAQRRARH